MPPVRVLFVCLGNICRSPMAEGLFAAQVQALALQAQFQIDSCGTGHWHRGELPDPRMRRTAERHGIVLTHRGRQLQPSDFVQFDYILCMDKQNLRDVQALAGQAPGVNAHIGLLRDYEGPAKGSEVDDPYYGDMQAFEHCYQTLERATRLLLNTLIARHQLA